MRIDLTQATAEWLERHLTERGIESDGFADERVRKFLGSAMDISMSSVDFSFSDAAIRLQTYETFDAFDLMNLMATEISFGKDRTYRLHTLEPVRDNFNIPSIELVFWRQEGR